MKNSQLEAEIIRIRHQAVDGNSLRAELTKLQEAELAWCVSFPFRTFAWSPCLVHGARRLQEKERHSRLLAEAHQEACLCPCHVALCSLPQLGCSLQVLELKAERNKLEVPPASFPVCAASHLIAGPVVCQTENLEASEEVRTTNTKLGKLQAQIEHWEKDAEVASCMCHAAEE